jgi:methyl-accepting chemotaxis protein
MAVAGFFTRSLSRRLVVAFLMVALVPVMLVGYLSDSFGRRSLYNAEFRKLNELREEKSAQVRAYLASVIDSARFLADYDQVITTLTQSASDRQVGQNPGDNQAATGEDDFVNKLVRVLTKYVELRGQYESEEDVLLIRPSGHVIASMDWLADYGANLKTGDLRDSGLGQVWQKVMKSQKPAITDFSIYKPSGAAAAFVAAPVFTRENRFCGVLAIRIGTNRLSKILKVTDAAGKTAEAYLVGSDGLMRSQSNYTDEISFLRKRVETGPAKAALRGQKGHAVATNYLGKRVFSSYGITGIRDNQSLGADFDWAILAEIGKSEAIGPVVQITHRFALIVVAVVGAVLMAAFFLARSLTKPITTMVERVNRVSEGDLTVQVGFQGRADEIGQLAQAIEVMVSSAQDQIRRILEGVYVLSSCATEISTTVAKLSMSTAQASSAVTETSTTVEQVKQAAQVSGAEAKRVAETARHSVQVSAAGEKATEGTISRMNLIQEQIAIISETVLTLSAHSRAITNLIGTVQDLADQSNLLAVNASIEAARAGDQGKGFAVVAREIKALADQSRGATEQMRKILDDNGNRVSAVVMATEQGSKAVEGGVRQAELAGSSIQALTGSVSESSRAANTIGSSIEQQSAGVHQVAMAMASIEQAMHQNVAVTAQLEGSARKLQQLGGSLQELVQRYTV